MIFLLQTCFPLKRHSSLFFTDSSSRNRPPYSLHIFAIFGNQIKYPPHMTLRKQSCHTLLFLFSNRTRKLSSGWSKIKIKSIPAWVPTLSLTSMWFSVYLYNLEIILIMVSASHYFFIFPGGLLPCTLIFSLVKWQPSFQEPGDTRKRSIQCMWNELEFLLDPVDGFPLREEFADSLGQAGSDAPGAAPTGCRRILGWSWI